MRHAFSKLALVSQRDQLQLLSFLPTGEVLLAKKPNQRLDKGVPTTVDASVKQYLPPPSHPSNCRLHHHWSSVILGRLQQNLRLYPLSIFTAQRRKSSSNSAMALTLLFHFIMKHYLWLHSHDYCCQAHLSPRVLARRCYLSIGYHSTPFRSASDISIDAVS